MEGPILYSPLLSCCMCCCLDCKQSSLTPFTPSEKYKIRNTIVNRFLTVNSKICSVTEGFANENLYKALDENPEIIARVFQLHLHHSLDKSLFHFQISDNAVNNEVFSIHSLSSARSGLSDYLTERIKCYLANRFCSYPLFHLDLSFPESPLAVKPDIRFNI